MKTIPLAALLLLATPLHAASVHSYTCDNGEKLGITFGQGADGRPQATLHRPGGDIVLPLVPAASGARYRADPLDLHTKGDDAYLEDADGRQLRCTRGTPPGAVAPTPTIGASSFITLTGGVAYRSREALPPDAILIIRVEDVGRRGSRVLAEQRYELNGTQVPVFFNTTIDRDLIGKRARVRVAAHIEIDGQVRYINDRPYPAMENGQPLPLAIMLKPVHTGTR